MERWQSLSGCLSVVVSRRRHLSRAGAHRRRHQREDPEGRPGQLEDPPDHALPHGCVRAAADRLAQPEGGRRVGDQGNGVVGLRQRPSRAVGFRPARLDERRRCRRDRVAGQGQARVRSAGVDARHGRHGQGQGVQYRSSRRSRRRRNSRSTSRASRPSVENAIVLVGRVERRCLSTSSRRPSERADESLRDRYNGTPGGGGRTRRARPR